MIQRRHFPADLTDTHLKYYIFTAAGEKPAYRLVLPHRTAADRGGSCEYTEAYFQIMEVYDL